VTPSGSTGEGPHDPRAGSDESDSHRKAGDGADEKQHDQERTSSCHVRLLYASPYLLDSEPVGRAPRP